MAYVFAPTLRIRSIEWSLDRPAQANVSAWTGKRTVAVDPWHGQWRARAELAPIVGQANVLSTLAFLARCKGQLATFKMPATEGAQNGNSGVTVAFNAAAGDTALTITGEATTLLPGQKITVNDQLLQLTDVESHRLYFEPKLRENAFAGTPVETARPYALVYLSSSTTGYSVEPGQVYGVTLDVEEAVGESVASSNALSLEFTSQRYMVNGVRKAALASVSGYAFSRTGSQGAADARGTVAFFGANVPAINSSGFHCYQSVTNLLTTSNPTTGQADPAGGTSAGQISTDTQNVTVSTATTYTISTYAKRNATDWLRLRAADGTNNASAWFNLNTGAAGTSNTSGTGISVIGSTIVPLGNGWYRCVLRFQSATATTITVSRVSVTADASNTSSGDFFGYQRQCLNGSFPNGGPIIATTGSAATIGASDLELAASLPNGDFIAWAAVNLSGVPTAFASPFSYSTAGAGSTAERLWLRFNTSGNLTIGLINAGGSAQPSPVAIPSVVTGAGRVVAMIRRKNGVYSFAAKKADGTIVIGGDASGIGAVPAVTAVEIGARYDGTEPLNGQVEGFFQRNGTFTDSQITAILGDA